MFTTRVLRHKTMLTYSRAITPLGQSERAYYLSYFIKQYEPGRKRMIWFRKKLRG